MKYLFVFLLVGLTSIIFGQNRYHIDKTTFALKDSIVYLKSDMTPINGVLYCEFGENGMCVNGWRNGLHRVWYENGQLQYEANFKDGKVDGLYRDWYEDGQLQYETNCKDGYLDGLNRGWYENGQLYFTKNYKYGMKHGIMRHWFRNGQLMVEYNYKDGKSNGICRNWHENGQLWFEMMYKDDKRTSSKCWDEDGNVDKCPED